MGSFMFRKHQRVRRKKKLLMKGLMLKLKKTRRKIRKI